MTSIGELLGNEADKIAQDIIEIGDIHFLKQLDESNGITPNIVHLVSYGGASTALRI